MARSVCILAWKWGQKYPAEYVTRLAAGVARHYRTPHRFICATDDPSGLNVETVPIRDIELTKVDDGCYCRLAAFDPDWQREIGAQTIVWLDLDLICVDDLSPLFDRPEPLIMLAKSHYNPCPVNGSVLKVDAGAHPEIWRSFTVEGARKIAMADGTWRGSDQTWLAAKAPSAATWSYLDGAFSWKKPGWPGGDALPAGARLVAFPGAKDPARLMHIPWVAEHWRR